jgi:5-formyltetrahydrofolate cyclo-ligase
MILEPSDTIQRKTLARSEMRMRRRALSHAERLESSTTISELLWDFFSLHREKLISCPIAVYLALPDEISIDPLISLLLEAKFTLCAPRIDLESDEMNFWELSSLDAVSEGKWKIREPIANQIIMPQIALLPALAFDASGHRLGMGGGWYDKTLARLETNGKKILKIGVCFENQLLAEVPYEPHDLSVDYVACGKRLIVINERL